MALEIHVLDLGDVELESSFLVHARECGKTYRVPTFGYLILGGEAPVLVDTGYRNTQIMERLGMRGIQTDEQRLESQLAKHGLKFADIKYVLHTHMHIDHGGGDDLFPMTTTVGLNRREMECAVSGLMGEQYPAEDIKHLIDRLHTRKSLRLFDTDLTGSEEIIPGVVCTWAGAHTDGSMVVLVETAEGVAGICGDVIYDFVDQVIEPHHDVSGYVVLDAEPTPTGNHVGSMRSEIAAIKKLLNTCAFICPTHDRPAKIQLGAVVGRMHDSIPGPVSQVSVKRNWMRL
ncbi:N-acyl homoserine lactonase family protein [Burkholderia orbicola]|uniref:N-acyl homoserine lactonase family protein n=1 Tax=Burkholderia orbicola TaxID=2978683 RepID=UPI00264B264A|nr:N-acyl homoserine lactonase family protein [Burkholderia orbicola]MDN7560784.1 N-acyl homoserine lactonase family protein [Burkholderia orbicola]